MVAAARRGLRRRLPLRPPGALRRDTEALVRRARPARGPLLLRPHDDYRPAASSRSTCCAGSRATRTVVVLVDDDPLVLDAARAAGFDVLPATWMGEHCPALLRGPGARRPHLIAATGAVARRGRADSVGCMTSSHDRRLRSPRCPTAGWPRPPWPGPRTSTSATPTSASSGSAPRTSGCATAGCRAPPTARTSASPSGWCSTAPGASPPASCSTAAGRRSRSPRPRSAPPRSPRR